MWYRKPRTSVRSLGKDESGANAVEFALVILVLIPFILAILEFGILLFTYNNMVQTARETARVMAVQEAILDDAELVVDRQFAFTGMNYGYCICQATPRECRAKLITPCPPLGIDDGDGKNEVYANISVPLAEASLIDYQSFFSTGDLEATVTMQKE